MNHLTIGEMARLNNVTKQTLQLYDRMGLLRPSRVGANGYRYYDIVQSARLDMIQHMKSLGMGLKEILEHLESRDMPRIIEILEKKREQIDRKVVELALQKRGIERTIESFKRYESAPPDGAVVLEYIGKRHLYVAESNHDFIEGGIVSYESMLRGMRQQMQADGLPDVFFWNQGSIIRREHFLEGKFLMTEAFVLVDEDYAAAKRVRTIPPNTYQCIYCDNFDKEREYALELLNSIKNHGYTVCGDYICEVIYEPPVPNGNKRGMYLRLQAPVKF